MGLLPWGVKQGSSTLLLLVAQLYKNVDYILLLANYTVDFRNLSIEIIWFWCCRHFSGMDRIRRRVHDGTPSEI